MRSRYTPADRAHALMVLDTCHGNIKQTIYLLSTGDHEGLRRLTPAALREWRGVRDEERDIWEHPIWSELTRSRAAWDRLAHELHNRPETFSRYLRMNPVPGWTEAQVREHLRAWLED